MNYCYIRVSTDKQDHERQENILKEKGFINGVNCEYIKEIYTGTTAKRPVLTDLIENKLKAGDTLISCELSRISRSVRDFNDLIDKIIKEKKVNITILKENFHLLANGQMDAMTKLILNITSSFAEFERDLISDRTKESLKAKKINGTKSGRPLGHPISEYNTQENFINTIKYQINNDCGQYRASLNTKFPTNSYQTKLRECFVKYNTKDLQIILEHLEKEL